MERKIRRRDKEQDRKWDEKERERDKDGGHKSRKEPRPKEGRGWGKFKKKTPLGSAVFVIGKQTETWTPSVR